MPEIDKLPLLLPGSDLPSQQIEVVSTLLTEPDYLVPIDTEPATTDDMMGRSYWEDWLDRDSLSLQLSWSVAKARSIKKYSKRPIEETINEIIRWDENKNTIYLEALAYLGDAKKFVRFRKNIETELNVSGFPCMVCGCSEWKARNVDAKTVVDTKGRRWKCFSVLFACTSCLEQSRLSERSIRMQGWKQAFTKVAKGAKDFLNRIKKIMISGNLSDGSGSATIDLGDEQVKLERCPLL